MYLKKLAVRINFLITDRSRRISLKPHFLNYLPIFRRKPTILEPLTRKILTEFLLILDSFKTEFPLFSE